MTVAQRKSGRNTQAYRGVTSATPVQFTVQARAPMEHDYAEWNIGAVWLQADQKIPGAQIIWMLVRKINGNATWIQFGGDGLQFLTGDTGGQVGPDGASNINFITNFSPFSLDGSPSTFTLTLNVDGTVPISFSTDGAAALANAGSLSIDGGIGIDTSASGNTITIAIDDSVPVTHNTDSGSATAVSNEINVSGGTGVSTSGSGNNLTISLDGATTSFVTDAGTAVPAAGILEVLGGLNINTSGSGNSVTVATPTLSEGVMYTDVSGVYTSLGKGDDGEILISATGGTPSWNTITSTGGSIAITNGANSINLENNNSGTISIAFFAYKTTVDSNVTGQGQQVFYVCDTEEYDLGSDYDHTTGIFTAPSAGTYVIGAWIDFDMPNLIPVPTVIDPNGEIGIVTSGGLTFIGGEYDVFRNDRNNQHYTVNGEWIIQLAASETVKPYARVSNDTATRFGINGTNSVGPPNFTRVTAFWGYRLT